MKENTRPDGAMVTIESDRGRRTLVKTATRDSRLADRYVAMLDILGFRQLVRSKPMKEVVALIESLIERASNLAFTWSASQPGVRAAGGTYRPRKLHFSDTIVFWSPPITGRPPYESTVVGLFFDAVSRFVYDAFLAELPIRIGVAFGETYIDVRKRIIVGQAVVDAHLTELSQDWIGGALHPNSSTAQFARQHWRNIIEYPVPTRKDAPVLPRYALNWIALATAAGQAQLKREGGFSPRETFEAAFRRYFARDMPLPVRQKYENAKWFYELQKARRPRMDLLGKMMD